MQTELSKTFQRWYKLILPYCNKIKRAAFHNAMAFSFGWSFDLQQWQMIWRRRRTRPSSFITFYSELLELQRNRMCKQHVTGVHAHAPCLKHPRGAATSLSSRGFVWITGWSGHPSPPFQVEHWAWTPKRKHRKKDLLCPHHHQKWCRFPPRGAKGEIFDPSMNESSAEQRGVS